MIKYYPKGISQRLSEHFNVSEFHCKCQHKDCGITLVDSTLIEALEKLREIVGPITINDGFRCDRHNAEVDGKPQSQHMIGRAADIVVKKMTSDQVYKIADKKVPEFKNGGIGKYPSFTHVDVRADKARW